MSRLWRRQWMIVVTHSGLTMTYLRFGVCESALAAADFSVFVLFLFESTLLAADAALDPVCRVFLLAI